MLAPALDAIRRDPHIGPDEANVTVSVFVLGLRLVRWLWPP